MQAKELHNVGNHCKQDYNVLTCTFVLGSIAGQYMGNHVQYVHCNIFCAITWPCEQELLIDVMTVLFNTMALVIHTHYALIPPVLTILKQTTVVFTQLLTCFYLVM